MRRLIEELWRWANRIFVPPFPVTNGARILAAATVMALLTVVTVAQPIPLAVSENNLPPITSVAPFLDIPPEVLDPNFTAWQPTQPVRTIPVVGLRDIAMAGFDNFGPYIVYNPQLAAQTPPKVMAFFMAHEYGHIYLRTSNEVAADEFAARVYAEVDPSVVRAAAWWMVAFPNGGDMTHPSSPVRARDICRVSGAC